MFYDKVSLEVLLCLTDDIFVLIYRYLLYKFLMFGRLFESLTTTH